MVWMVLEPDAEDVAPSQFEPNLVATSYQYCFPEVRVPLVHDVVAMPLATEEKPLVADVVDW
jgi:hypothetical protein